MNVDAASTTEHLRHLSNAAIVALLRLLDRTSDEGVERSIERHPFLFDYVADVARSVGAHEDWDATFDHFLDEVRAFERDHERLPLLRVDALGDIHARLVYAFIGLANDDIRFGAVAQMLQVPCGHPAFAPQTIASALDDPGERRTHHVVDALLERHLVRSVDDAPGSGPGGLQVDATVWNLVRDGDHPRWRESANDIAVMDHWHHARRDELVNAVRGLLAEQYETMVVRSVPGAGASEVLEAAASLNGASTVAVGPDALATGSAAAAAVVQGAIPVVEVNARPGNEEASPRPSWYRGPLIVVMGRSGGIRPDGDRRLHATIERGDAAERTAFWQSVRPQPTETPELLANAFVLPDGYLRRIVRDATSRSHVDGRQRPQLDDVRAAARSIGEHALETRAAAVPTDGLNWEDLVVSDVVASSLKSLARRCELREEIAAGQRSRGAVGVRALLLGPSGVGKTLAATVLASQLGRRAYRVDLAAIFDKFVGETEKHLDQILAAAEQLDCVLLIDEGDTLLGARTDGSTANDRYANLETNFLLQRLEDYTGIVVVTSNAGDRIDPAFARRMETTITFARPRAAERDAILRLHLPSDHLVSDDALRRLAVSHRLTGGQIRNAALHGRMLALDDRTAVAERHIDAAIVAEYQKSGRLPTGGRHAAIEGARHRDAFLAAQQLVGDRRRKRIASEERGARG